MTRCLQRVEVYQKLYYNEKIRGQVEDACRGQALTAGERLKIVKRLSREEWDRATDEERGIVSARLAEIEIEMARLREVDKAAAAYPPTRPPTTMQMQRCVPLAPSHFYC
jgi:hypothetical protein